MGDSIKTESNLIRSTSTNICWTRDETNLLLSVMVEKNILKLFNEKKYPRENILKIIENEFQKSGFTTKNTQHINDKWKSLTERYSKYAEKANTSRDKISMKKCPYYEELDNIFKTVKSCDNVKTPLPVAQSLTDYKTESIKCGEIFYVNDNLTYICFLCEHTEKSSRKFEEHFYTRHLNDLPASFLLHTNETDLDYHKVHVDCITTEPLNFEVVEVKEELDELSELLTTKNNENCALDNTSTTTTTAINVMLDTSDNHNEGDSINNDENLIQASETTTNNNPDSGIFHNDAFLIKQNIIFKCYHCDMIFKTKKPMTDHICKLKNFRFNCSVCGLGLCGRKRYGDHLKRLHNLKIDQTLHTATNAQPTFICDHCNLKLKDRTAYVKHMRTFKNWKFDCIECEKKFCGTHRFHYHNSISHNIKQNGNNTNKIQSPTSFVCYICKISCTTIRNLRLHMRTHTGERPYKCTQCDKAFSVKLSLKLHIHHHHTFERPFMCTECGACFVFQNLLNAHMKNTHRLKEENPTPCPICSKIIKNSVRLKVHLKTHTNERKFACKKCDKTFKTRTVYRQHLHIHLDKRRFECSVCDLTFSQAAGRRGHIRRVHEGIK